jgi:hypothetical protein
MRASTAFLVGIGTVGVAIVGGLGGGLLIADAMNPDPPKHRSEAAQLERRTPDAMSAAAALPYAAATLAFTDSSIDGSARTASQQANANPSSALTRSVTSTPKDTTPKSSQAAPAKQPAQDVQQAPSAMPPSAPEDANAPRQVTLISSARPKSAVPNAPSAGRTAIAAKTTRTAIAIRSARLATTANRAPTWASNLGSPSRECSAPGRLSGLEPLPRRGSTDLPDERR